MFDNIIFVLLIFIRNFNDRFSLIFDKIYKFNMAAVRTGRNSQTRDLFFLLYLASSEKKTKTIDEAIKINIQQLAPAHCNDRNRRCQVLFPVFNQTANEKTVTSLSCIMFSCLMGLDVRANIKYHLGLRFIVNIF